MRVFTKIYVPHLKKAMFVDEKTINNQKLELGNHDQIHTVRRLQTHTGRKLYWPEKTDIIPGKKIIKVTMAQVTYENLKTGKVRSVDRNYFIRKYYDIKKRSSERAHGRGETIALV